MRLFSARIDTPAWFVGAFLLLLALPASAQEISRQEITLGANAQTFGVFTCTPINGGPQCAPRTDHWVSEELALTYTYNLSTSLAIEGTVQPTSAFRNNNGLNAGRETLALGGIKTGWRGQRWGVYSEVRAGMASYSCGNWYWGTTGPYHGCARMTHFALEYGGAAEYRVSRRYSLRVDAGHLQIAEFDNIVQRYADGTPFVYMGGGVLHHADLQLGVTRRFGALREAEREPVPQAQTFDAGVFFSIQPRVQTSYNFLNVYPQWGVWGSWNFSRHVSWDTSLLHSPRNAGKIETIDYQSGGRAFEALSGVKIGIRRDHMGYFAKVRPGIITFGETERQISVLPNGYVNFDEGMFTNFVLDTGGVYEVYPSRHSILRFEAGSATIFYLPKTAVFLGEKIPIDGEHHPSMLIGFGAGVRF